MDRGNSGEKISDLLGITKPKLLAHNILYKVLKMYTTSNETLLQFDVFVYLCVHVFVYLCISQLLLRGFPTTTPLMTATNETQLLPPDTSPLLKIRSDLTTTHCVLLFCRITLLVHICNACAGPTAPHRYPRNCPLQI